MNGQNVRASKLTTQAIIWFHFLAVVLHSAAHEVLGVKATRAQLAFIVPVIIVAPVAAAFVLRKRHAAGSALLLISMIGSFFFGLYYHFVADTIDHVAHVARLEPAFWSAVFRVTAYLLLASEALGSVVAGLSLAGRPRPVESYAARTGL